MMLSEYFTLLLAIGSCDCKGMILKLVILGLQWHKLESITNLVEFSFSSEIGEQVKPF